MAENPLHFDRLDYNVIDLRFGEKIYLIMYRENVNSINERFQLFIMFGFYQFACFYTNDGYYL